MAKYDFLKDIIKIIAPGTPLRMGIDNILNAKSGALVLLMNEEDIIRSKNLIQPGFYVNCEYTAQRIYELAKMDGAVIMDEDATRILYANVQLTPDPSIPTKETGMRHRNAERMAKQTGKAAIAISRRRSIVSIYWGAYSYVLNDLNFLITKVNQGLKTIEKYSDSYGKALDLLDTLETENRVTLFDVCKTLEKGVKAKKIEIEIEPYIWEMGLDGRMAKIQMDEMLSELEDNLIMIITDYYNQENSIDMEKAKEIYDKIFNFSEKDLMDYVKISHFLGYGNDNLVTEINIVPKGFRLMGNIPKIPLSVSYNLVKVFGNLKGISEASSEELMNVEGIGEKRSQAIIDGLESLKKNKSSHMR